MNGIFKQIITKNELWFLSRFFAPGIIFGFTDPLKDVDSDQITLFEKDIKESLMKKKLFGEVSGSKVQIDEMLGGMVYSCVNADLIVQVRDVVKDQIHYLYLMQDWLLSVDYKEEVEFCLYQNKEVLFDELFGKTSVAQKGKMDFLIPVLELDMGLSLLKEEDEVSLSKLFANQQKELNFDLSWFLNAYAHADLHYVFNSICKNQDTRKISNSKVGVVKIEDVLFWFEKVNASENEVAHLKFDEINADELKTKFEEMIRL